MMIVLIIMNTTTTNNTNNDNDNTTNHQALAERLLPLPEGRTRVRAGHADTGPQQAYVIIIISIIVIYI